MSSLFTTPQPAPTHNMLITGLSCGRSASTIRPSASDAKCLLPELCLRKHPGDDPKLTTPRVHLVMSTEFKILIICTMSPVVFEEASGNEDGCICVIVVKHQVAQAISRDLRSPSQQSVCIAVTANVSTVAKRPVSYQPAPTLALFHGASSGARLPSTTLSGATHTTWVSLLPSPKDAAMTHGIGC
jgi:hypothetical protein